MCFFIFFDIIKELINKKCFVRVGGVVVISFCIFSDGFRGFMCGGGFVRWDAWVVRSLFSKFLLFSFDVLG